MILGIGIDLISIKRIQELLAKFPQGFKDKVFSENENKKATRINDLNKQISFYAKRFAAKEAFAKACGLGIGRGINFNEIEILNDEFGKPHLKLLNNKEDFLKDHFKTTHIKIDVSLTDEENLAQALVIISN